MTSSARPHRSRRTHRPLPTEGRGVSAHGLRPSPRGHCAPRRGSGWGSGAPRLPLRSPEKAFSPRASRASPDHLSLGPTEAHQEPPVLSWAGGLCGMGKRTTTRERVRGQGRGRARAPPSQGLTRQPPRGEHTVLLSPSRPPVKESHSWDTHTPPWRGPEEDTGSREKDTAARPQAPEGQPGALRGRRRGSNEARSHTHVGARHGSGTALPTAEGRSGHTPGRRSKRVCLCPKTNGPTRHPKAGDGRPKVRAGGHTPTPAFLTLPKGQGGKTGEGPRGQTEKSGHVHWERPSLVRPGRARPHHISHVIHFNFCEMCKVCV